MKRRDFSAAVGSAVAACAMAPAMAQAQGGKLEAGADYLVLDKRVPSDVPAGKVEVIEFFWYSCPHCHAFEPTLEAWVKRAPAQVLLRRVPVAFRDDFVPQQRLYYALEALGLVEKLHAKVFAAIHAQKLQLVKGDAIADWVATQGVDKAKFVDQYNSFSVSTKATRATQLQNMYRVEGVPAMGVAGRFYTDGTLARNMERVLQVVEFLMAEVRAGR